MPDNNNANEPAFPRPHSTDASGDYPEQHYAFEGLTKREYIATNVYTSVLANAALCAGIMQQYKAMTPETANKAIAMEAIAFTDTFLKALSETN
jgi:hypothetical protein